MPDYDELTRQWRAFRDQEGTPERMVFFQMRSLNFLSQQAYLHRHDEDLCAAYSMLFKRIRPHYSTPTLAKLDVVAHGFLRYRQDEWIRYDLRQRAALRIAHCVCLSATLLGCGEFRPLAWADEFWKRLARTSPLEEGHLWADSVDFCPFQDLSLSAAACESQSDDGIASSFLAQWEVHVDLYGDRAMAGSDIFATSIYRTLWDESPLPHARDAFHHNGTFEPASQDPDGSLPWHPVAPVRRKRPHADEPVAPRVFGPVVERRLDP